MKRFQISPAGLGLPDRRYYYRQQDAEVSSMYTKIIKHIKTKTEKTMVVIMADIFI